jgi:hypothetical protein
VIDTPGEDVWQFDEFTHSFDNYRFNNGDRVIKWFNFTLMRQLDLTLREVENSKLYSRYEVLNGNGELVLRYETELLYKYLQIDIRGDYPILDKILKKVQSKKWSYLQMCNIDRSERNFVQAPYGPKAQQPVNDNANQQQQGQFGGK